MPYHLPPFWVDPTGHMPSENLPQTWGVPPPCLSWVVVGGSLGSFMESDAIHPAIADRSEGEEPAEASRMESDAMHPAMADRSETL